MRKNKVLKKAIRHSFEQTEGDSIISQLVEKDKYIVTPLQGVEDDIAEYLSKTSKQIKEIRNNHYNNLIANILKGIETKGEIVFVTRPIILDHFLTENKFNSLAYFDFRYRSRGEFNSYDQFCKRKLPELVTKGIFSFADIYIVVDDLTQETLFVFYLLTKSCAAEKFREMIERFIIVGNKSLIGDPSVRLDALIIDSRENLSWRGNIWIDKIQDYEDIIDRKIDESDIYTVKARALQYFKDILNKLNESKFLYPDEKEWDHDLKLLNSSIEDTEKSDPYKERMDKMVFTPTRMNFITVNDLAQNLRRWILKYINPEMEFKLRYGTRDDEAKAWGRDGRIIHQRLEVIESRSARDKEFQKQYNLNCLPYGKVFLNLATTPTTPKII